MGCTAHYENEEAIFKAAAVYPIPSCQRETAKVISQAMEAPLTGGDTAR